MKLKKELVLFSVTIALTAVGMWSQESVQTQDSEKEFFCPLKNSRSISSVDDADEPEAEESQIALICQQQNQISNLEAELEKLQVERERVLAVFKEYEEELDSVLETRDLENENQAPYHQSPIQIVINQSWANSQPPLQLAAPITYAYSPFHGNNQQNNYEYLNMVAAQRLAFSMKEDQYWHPEWDSGGNLMNPQYGHAGTWSFLEDMYRNPMGQPTREPTATQSQGFLLGY